MTKWLIFNTFQSCVMTRTNVRRQILTEGIWGFCVGKLVRKKANNRIYRRKVEGNRPNQSIAELLCAYIWGSMIRLTSDIKAARACGTEVDKHLVFA